MKQFVTGAAGFIGSNYVRHVLEETDDSVTIYDALTYAGNLESIRDLIDLRCAPGTGEATRSTSFPDRSARSL